MTPFEEAVLRCLVFLLRLAATKLRDHRDDKFDARDCECEACALRRMVELEAT